MKGRRTARTLAFQVLFEMDMRPDRALADALEHRVRSMTEENGRALDEEIPKFARALVEGTVLHREELDDRIHQAAPAFPITQMPMVDRVCLELGAYDLLHGVSASVPVVINEAVELAKTYGGGSSSRFVNGVLGTIAEELATRTATPLPGSKIERSARRDQR
jgi:N utilization substance protein B